MQDQIYLFRFTRFTEWPKDALQRVADMFIGQMDFDAELSEHCVLICQHFHTTIKDLSDVFFKEQKRKTYVTPTSYLELIQTFKSLYYMKVNQITVGKMRLAVNTLVL